MADLAISTTKLELFVPLARFLKHHIYKGQIMPTNRTIISVEKFLDEIIDKNMLQMILGSLN